MISLKLQTKTYGQPPIFNCWMLVIGYEHSNFRVWGDIKPLSSSSNNLFSYWLWKTQCWDGKTPPFDNGDEITYVLYIYFLLFISQSRWNNKWIAWRLYVKFTRQNYRHAKNKSLMKSHMFFLSVICYIYQ